MVWIEKFSWVQLRPPRAPGKEAFLLMGYALFQWNVHFTLRERTRVPNPSPNGQWLEVGFGPSMIWNIYNYVTKMVQLVMQSKLSTTKFGETLAALEILISQKHIAEQDFSVSGKSSETSIIWTLEPLVIISNERNVEMNLCIYFLKGHDW